MSTHTIRISRLGRALLVAGVLAFAACGDDDDGDPAATTAQVDEGTGDPAATTAQVNGEGGEDGEDGEDGDATGTWRHPEEGTIELEDGGTGTITQSAEPVAFDWSQDGDTISFTFEGAGVAEATLEGDELTFRPGDFSGDDPVTFTRSGD